DGAAFPHGQVMGGIEARGCQVSECSDLASSIGCPYCIAAILNQPEAVLLDEIHDRMEIEWVAQGMGDHDGAGARGSGRFELAHVDVISRDRDVHEHGYEAVLYDRIDRGRKARG